MLFNFGKLVSMTTLVTVLSTLITYPASTTAAPSSLVPRAQCAATLSTASVSDLRSHAVPGAVANRQWPYASPSGNRPERGDPPAQRILERGRMGHLLDRRRAYDVMHVIPVVASQQLTLECAVPNRTRSRTSTTLCWRRARRTSTSRTPPPSASSRSGKTAARGSPS